MKKSPIKRVFLASDICVITAVVVAGCAFLPFGPGWRELGYVIVACGLSMCPFFLHGYKIEGHSGTFRLAELPVSREYQNAVMAFLNGDTDELDVKQSDQGGALVSIYSRKGGGEILAQYFDYAELLKDVEFPIVSLTPERRDKLKAACPQKRQPLI